MDSDTSSRAGSARHAIVERWGGNASILAEGFVPVPRVFLRLAGTLPLTPTETLFVIQLMSWKWDDRDPFPSYRSIAERMGVSVPYARKLARSLEDKELLKRQTRRSQTNIFDLTPLFTRLCARVDDEQLPF